MATQGRYLGLGEGSDALAGRPLAGNLRGLLFRSAVGTGGTLAGVALGLREHKPEVAIAIADPFGASLYNYYAHGELKAEGTSVTEGIGQSRITANLQGLTVDYAYQVPDDEALAQVFDLTQHEGLCMGGSTGITPPNGLATSTRMPASRNA